MRLQKIPVYCLTVALWCALPALAKGPYTESGISGYVNSNGLYAEPGEPGAVINPIFRGWATGFVNYEPADDAWSGPWNQPEKALGPATGSGLDVVSLGELSRDEIAAGKKPGEITFTFGNPDDPNIIDDPCFEIQDRPGYDLVVFENGFIADFDTTAGSTAGKMFMELGYVEVSSDNMHFARFPSVSLTKRPQGNYAYLSMEVSNVYNLAGKHPNAYGICTGTPFDLSDLRSNPLVVSGEVDLNHIRYVRIIDIPGSGDFSDSAIMFVNPQSGPAWQTYSQNHAIYDAWPGWGSGGLDIDAVGVLREQKYAADFNLDGVVDLSDLTLFCRAWQSLFGDDNWNSRCDISQPRDYTIDLRDFQVLAGQWLKEETWRIHN